MTALSLFASLLLAAALQVALPTASWLGRTPAPILPALVVYYALMRSRSALLAAALAAGIVQDALGMTPFGYSSLCFCAAGLAVRRFRDDVFIWKGLTEALFGALAYAGITLAMYALLRGSGAIALGPSALALKLPGALLLGAAATPLVYRALERLDLLLGLIEPERMRGGGA